MAERVKADAIHVDSCRPCHVMRLAPKLETLGAWVVFTDENAEYMEWFPLVELLIIW